MSTAPVPRVAPVPVDQRSEDVRELLRATRLPNGRELDLIATLAHHPGLLRRWWPFGAKLLAAGRLPIRDRELVILRTAWNCRCDYEWGQHVSIADQAGVTETELNEVRAPDVERTTFGELEQALLRAADEMHRDAEVSDATWSVLASHYDVPQLIELCMLVGQYHLVAFTLRSLRVARETGVPGFPP